MSNIELKEGQILGYKIIWNGNLCHAVDCPVSKKGAAILQEASDKNPAKPTFTTSFEEVERLTGKLDLYDKKEVVVTTEQDFTFPDDLDKIEEKTKKKRKPKKPTSSEDAAKTENS